MKSVIVGTAGHIDHGKSALVRALTGIDPDRLEEEKRRGITIDLGFASLDLNTPAGEPLRVGFVDVPGHERFVRNMLAGIGGIDMVLLVISAEESVKPQTREHFDICRLLNIQRGIVVLTKSDLVDSDTLAVARDEAEELVRGSFLERAPIVPASAVTGAGLEELRREMVRIAAEVPERSLELPFRLPIDRVFTMKGFGTVVTGTLTSGNIGKDEEVEVLPLGRRVRVRGIQVHGASADRAVAGQRTALNLAGVDVEELARGMMLAPPGLFRATTRVDASIQLLPDAKPLKHQSRVHLHAFSAETIAEVRLLDPGKKQIGAGDSSYVQLRFAEPLLLLPGDRFVVRQFSPVVTIGGGVTIDVSGFRPSRSSFARLHPVGDSGLNLLRALETATPESSISIRVNRQLDRGATVADLTAEMGLSEATVRGIVSQLVASGKLVACDERVVGAAPFHSAISYVLSELTKFHDENRLVPGIGKEELRGRVGLEQEVFSPIVASLASQKKIVISGDVVSLAGRGVAMQSAESQARALIERTFADAGLKVPYLKDVLAGLKLDRSRAQQIVTLLLREKVLIKIGEDLVFHQSALHGLRELVSSQKTKSSKLDVGRFKDLTGVSRKYAIPLLEYLDRERVTRRVGDERVIL